MPHSVFLRARAARLGPRAVFCASAPVGLLFADGCRRPAGSDRATWARKAACASTQSSPSAGRSGLDVWAATRWWRRNMGRACVQDARGGRGRAPAAVGRVHGPAEVGDLQLALHAEQQVLGLDVPVDHVLGVAIHERARQGRDVPARRPPCLQTPHLQHARTAPGARGGACLLRRLEESSVLKRSAQGAADRGASRRGTKDSSHWQPAPRQDGRGAARGGAHLVEAVAPLQLPVQLALCRILQDQVHAVLRGAPALGAQQRSYM